MNNKEVKDFWEEVSPCFWYSNKEVNTKEWFNEIEEYRYTKVHPHILKIVKDNYNHYHNKKLLDIGCGMGMDLLQFARNGCDVTGIDITNKGINTARILFKLNKINAKFYRMDCENLKFKDNSFDFIVSFGCIHHTTSIKKAIREIKRALKKDGRFAIMIYSKGWSYYLRHIVYNYCLKFNFLKMSIQETIHYYSRGASPYIKFKDKKSTSPQSLFFTKKEALELFEDFKINRIYKRHLGTTLKKYVPDVFSRIIGHHWIIEGCNSKKQKF